MIWFAYSRGHCIDAAIKAYHYGDQDPLILVANMRRANSPQYLPHEMDDLIADGVAYELWGLVQHCKQTGDDRFEDSPYDYYYDNRGAHRAIYLYSWFRPGTLEWDRAERELAPQLLHKRGIFQF